MPCLIVLSTLLFLSATSFAVAADRDKAAAGYIFAQSGGTGGSIGKSGKSATGGTRKPKPAPKTPTKPAAKYLHSGSFACHGKARFPDAWRNEATCKPFGCYFGQLVQKDCLTLGARKGSKTVIHGKAGGGRSNECWLQHACGELRPHSDFSLFRR